MGEVRDAPGFSLILPEKMQVGATSLQVPPLLFA